MFFTSGKTPKTKQAFVYQHPAVGEVSVVHSLRARRLTLSVRPGGAVRLTVPRGVSQREALRFLDEKQDWIIRARERIQKRVPPPQLIEMPFSTRAHILKLFPGGADALRVRVASGAIAVSYPASLRYDDPPVQDAIRKGIEEAWRREAKDYLPQRTAELCRLLGFRCGEVTVRNTRTRWGSCSAADNISLNIHLMRLPDHLIDYVIVHELCHTVHKNHGPKFHNLLDEMTSGRHQALRRELKTHTTRW